MSELIDAIDEGDIDRLNKLLSDKNIDINETDDDGFTPLMFACSEGNEEIVKLLVKSGADLNLQDNYGETCLMKVDSPDSIEKANEITKYLIENRANPYLKDKYNRTALKDPYTKSIYFDFVLNKIKYINSKKKLAFAKIMINDKDIPEDIIRKILDLLELPSSKDINSLDKDSLDKIIIMFNKISQEELSREIETEIREKMSKEMYKRFKEKFPGEDIDDMIEFYRKQLKNPKLSKKQRKAYRKKKRTRKIRLKKTLGSSDLSTSRKSRSFNSEEDLNMAIKMSLAEFDYGKKKMKKSKRKRKSSKKSKKKSK